MDEHRIIIRAKNCRERTLQDLLSIETFLRNVVEELQAKVCHGPTTVKRSGAMGGTTVFLVTDHGFLAFSTTPTLRMASFEVCAHADLEVERVRERFLKHFNESIANIRIMELSRKPLDEVECEEAGCTRRATRDYNGRAVCHDHYDEYQEAIFKVRRNEYEHD
jgi:S-adenosylmethionine/arginine decarboxylase-like enzyme